MLHNEPLEEFHQHRCEGHRAVVIRAAWVMLPWHGDDGGFFEARRLPRLAERGVKDICLDIL